MLVVNFRLERYDDRGQQLAPVPVEIRGSSLQGGINEGDWVAVKGRWRPGETLHVRHVQNLTTGAPFGVRQGLGKVLAIAILAFVAVVVVAAIAVGVIVVFGTAQPVEQPRRIVPTVTRVR